MGLAVDMAVIIARWITFVVLLLFLAKVGADEISYSN
jgi:hypothetical protein